MTFRMDDADVPIVVSGSRRDSPLPLKFFGRLPDPAVASGQLTGEGAERVGLCAFASRTSLLFGQRPAQRHRRCRSCQETWTRSVRPTN
jgi:hypothetical protein